VGERERERQRKLDRGEWGGESRRERGRERQGGGKVKDCFNSSGRKFEGTADC
jgi:hypothetical protein